MSSTVEATLRSAASDTLIRSVISTESGSSNSTAEPGFCIIRHVESVDRDVESCIQPPHPFDVYRSTGHVWTLVVGFAVGGEAPSITGYRRAYETATDQSIFPPASTTDSPKSWRSFCATSSTTPSTRRSSRLHAKLGSTTADASESNRLTVYPNEALRRQRHRIRRRGSCTC